MKEISTTINMTRLAMAQGIFYALTGLWPLIDMHSFIAVTGPKVDLWLVRTVGILVLFIGSGVFVAGLRKQVTLPILIIAAGAALGLFVIDVTYVWLGIISPVYLLDAVAEFIIFALWIGLIFKKDNFSKNDSTASIDEDENEKNAFSE